MAPREKKAGPSTLTVADNLTHYRERAGYTMRGLAEVMTNKGFPLTHTVISQMENGARRIDVDDLSRLALVLEVSVAALLTPRNEDPEEVIGTTADQGDSARVAVRRLHEAAPDSPEWVREEIDTVTGAKWRHRIEGIQSVVAASGVFNTEDIETAATFAWGAVTKEKKQAEERNDGKG